MRSIITVIFLLAFLSACQQPLNKEKVKQEIFQTEKAFEKMSAEEGMKEAFYFFAADSAVIKRQNDTLIVGKENIKDYYSNPAFEMANVTWTPDFIDVSESGDLAYSYGKYLWTIWTTDGDTAQFEGVFQTVWKRQDDAKWKYVWD
ncbi:MAG TPA: nuclear transport factor 2 family protein [Ignavibacteriaceae bacterium]